jgi:hypothetical protein
MPETTAVERVKVTLNDGVERTLRYTLADMKEAKEHFGGSITKVETLQKIDEDDLGKLIWFGLRTDQPELSPEHIDRLLEPPMMKHVMGQYWRAISASLPETKNDHGPDVIAEIKTMMDRAEAILARAEAISTGSSSGASVDMTSDSPNGNSGASHSESSVLSQSATSSD